MNALTHAPPDAVLQLPAAQLGRLALLARRLGLPAEDALEAALDCFDELGDDWLAGQAWTLTHEE
jgi:hypothetical protein